MFFCAYAPYLISSSCVREIVRGISAIYVNRLKKVRKATKRAKIFRFQLFFGRNVIIGFSGQAREQLFQVGYNKYPFYIISTIGSWPILTFH